MANTAEFLENFRGPVLREVLLELGPVQSIVAITRDDLSAYTSSDEDGLQSGVYGGLESILLKFALPRITWIIDTPLSPSTGHDDRVTSLALSPDGNWAASASDDSTIILWDTSHRGVMTFAQQWVAHGYLEVLSLAFSPDSRHLLSHGEDGKAAIWDLSQSPLAGIRRAGTLEGASGSRVSSCAWCPDGSTLASGLWDGTVRLWDAHTFLPLRTLDRGSSALTTFPPSGHWLLSGSPPASFCVWDAETGRLHRVLESGLRADQPPRHEDQPMAAAFHPGGAYVAVTCGADSLAVWDIERGEPRLVRVLERLGRVDDVAFSPDGTLLLAVLDRRVLVWDFGTGEARIPFQAPGRGAVRGACFSRCGEYVASVSGDKEVWLWRIGDGQGRPMLEYEHAMEHVVFSTDGKTLLCGTVDDMWDGRRERASDPPCE
ncbi:hypothetical protein GSI_08176 [Ganoderma sinense ZZ0214-1]|uniref:Uncharacterized protein n=1 Tax=Ganoderma sinense ZZ0214-1 TaxID=1077348 RepID=A0A2G8S7N0_9APHY|nr:hypothetical protein GSI_08176 [Ganoderma sinense ZZ0214-1]